MEPTQHDSLPFLDTLITIQPDNKFSTTVYRKPTHIDQYLHWDSNHHITTKATIVVPYITNTSEKFKKVCKRKGIQVHFKGTNTLRTALENPKEKDTKANQTGIIYHYQYLHINCSSSYIGESGRTLGDRIKEHFKAPSPIHLHSFTTGHPMDPNQFSIVHKEVNSQPRTIKEAMFIHVQDPPLNRKLGKYQLPHIWDHLLQASPTLQCKPTNLPSNTTTT